MSYGVRKHPRVRAVVQAELRLAAESFPRRVQTANISLGGCYVEMLCTLEPRTGIQVILWLDGVKVRAWAEIVSNHLHLGNGIRFVHMAEADREALKNFIEKAQKVRSLPFQSAGLTEARV